MLRALSISLLLASPLCAQELAVMSFNIRYGTADDGSNSWEDRRELVFMVIREHETHVVGVQEALRFQLDEVRQAHPRFAEVGVGREDGDTLGEYTAILYDTSRLALLEHGTFWFSDTPEVPGSTSWGNRITRICTWARLRDRSVDNGGSFYVYNVHLDHESQPSRARSAELLAARIASREHPDRVIVLGDLNAGEANPVTRYLLGELSTASARDDAPPSPRLRDAFRAVHPDAGSVGTFHAFRGDGSGEKIDYVFVSPEWRIGHAAIIRRHDDGRYPSDHFPVTARVAW